MRYCPHSASPPVCDVLILSDCARSRHLGATKRHQDAVGISARRAGDGGRVPRNAWSWPALLVISCLAVQSLGLTAAAASTSVVSLKRLSLEQLMDLAVTSPTRSTEPLYRSASAVYVLRSDDIRRSGVNSIADALRLVPGMHVAQQNGRTWAISARGFNQTTANKLEVVFDGRSVYTPFFSGTFWDVQEYLLPDIEQIEIVRGPGGTLWGSNAVNGVINIMSKSSRDTYGTVLLARAGTVDNGLAGIRHGWQATPQTSARVYARYFQRDWLLIPTGTPAQSDREFWQTGFRTDTQLGPDTLLTTQGNAYSDRFGFRHRIGTDVEGSNLLARLHHNGGAGENSEFQAYFDHTDRDIPFIFVEQRDTVEVSFKRTQPIGDRNGLLWGLQARGSTDTSRNIGLQALRPAGRTLWLLGGYVQNRFDLIADTLTAAVGTKIEHHTYTDWEFQPSGRVAWHPTPRSTVWAAVSRAVRTPVRTDRDLVAPPTGVPILQGTPLFESEKLLSYQVGTRFELGSFSTFDVSLFENRYHDLRSTEQLAPPAVTRTFKNGNQARTRGAELSTRVTLSPDARFELGYAWFAKRVRPMAGARPLEALGAEGNDPRHVGFARLSITPTAPVEIDFYLRGVSGLPAPKVPGYLTGDVRVAWKIRKNLEWSIGARDLGDHRHPEFGAPTTRREELPRSYFTEITRGL